LPANFISHPEPDLLDRPPQKRPVRGWLLWLCFALTCLSPASSLRHIFSHTIPALVDPHTPIQSLLLFTIYLVLFVPLAVFSFLAGLRLWLVRPGAVRFAKHYLLAHMGAHIAYFVVYVLWILIFRSSWPNDLVDMGWGHVVGPTLTAALWYFYLERSTRVRATYLSGWGTVS
jgi:Protein of unknown function (DUF2569)